MEEDIRKGLRRISEGEDALLEVSLEKHPVSTHILFTGISLFEDLAVNIIQDGKIGKSEGILFQYLKDLQQSLYFGPIYALRGNIRACHIEMRFAIETVANFAYMTEKANLDELKRVCSGLIGKSDDELLTERQKINDRIRKRVYLYLEEKYPDENKSLQIFKKEIINNYYAHGVAMQPPNIGIRHEEGKRMIELSMFDSGEYREQMLERSLNTYSITLHSIFLIICSAIENKNNCNMDEYRKKIEEIQAQLKEHIPYKQKDRAE